MAQTRTNLRGGWYEAPCSSCSEPLLWHTSDCTRGEMIILGDQVKGIKYLCRTCFKRTCPELFQEAVRRHHKS